MTAGTRTKKISVLILFAASLASPAIAHAQAGTSATATESAQTAPPQQAELLKKTEAFLRNLFAWGADFKVELGPLGESASPDFYTVPIRITVNGQSDNGTVFVSKDGKTFLRGEMYSMSKDPFAETRAKLHLEGSPSKGPSDAKVTIVEFSDFQCPHCRVLHSTLQAIETEYPQVRIVFKNFPLTQIHPWAETAAIGAHCAYQQKPASFWQLQDLIFENQDLISSENAWDKLIGFSSELGLDPEAMKTCMSSPEAKQAIASDHAEGEALSLTSTPTVFVNGRTLVGGDKSTLEQFIQFAAR
jgi:protein-disulfide isomerase